MITEKLMCEEYIQYLSNTYIDFNGIQQNGLNKFNTYIESLGIEYQLNNFSNGYQSNWSEDFLLILQNSDNIDKNKGVLDQYAYEQTIKLNVELKMTGQSNILYTLVNYMPEVMNNLIVNYLNDEAEIKKYANYNLRYSTDSFLEFSDKNSPNPFSTVNSVIVRQTISVSRIKQIPII